MLFSLRQPLRDAVAEGGGAAGGLTGRANGNDHAFAAMDGRDVEIAGGGVIGYITENVLASGFVGNLGVDFTDVGGGKGQTRAIEVARLIAFVVATKTRPARAGRVVHLQVQAQ